MTIEGGVMFFVVFKISEHEYMSLNSYFLMSAIHFSYFTFCRCFTNVFAKHTMKYEILTIDFSYFVRISCFIDAAKK